MNPFKKSPTEPDLNHPVNKLLLELDKHPIDSSEYKNTLTLIERLMALKIESDPKALSPDTVVLVLAHLLGIGVIVGHERANLITSKAMGFVGKLLK